MLPKGVILWEIIVKISCEFLKKYTHANGSLGESESRTGLDRGAKVFFVSTLPVTSMDSPPPTGYIPSLC